MSNVTLHPVESRQRPLLTYTPPLQRDLQAPWKNGVLGQFSWDDELDYSIHLWRAHQRGDYRTAATPIIEVSTALEQHYVDAEFEDYATRIRFHDRAGWQVAYRLARIIKAHNGEGWIPRCDLRLIDDIDVAKHHNVEIIDGLFVFLGRNNKPSLVLL